MFYNIMFSFNVGAVGHFSTVLGAYKLNNLSDD